MIESVITDFGTGFVMDDHRMARDLLAVIREAKTAVKQLGETKNAFALRTQRCAGAPNWSGQGWWSRRPRSRVRI